MTLEYRNIAVECNCWCVYNVRPCSLGWHCNGFHLSLSKIWLNFLDFTVIISMVVHWFCSCINTISRELHLSLFYATSFACGSAKSQQNWFELNFAFLKTTTTLNSIELNWIPDLVCLSLIVWLKLLLTQKKKNITVKLSMAGALKLENLKSPSQHKPFYDSIRAR